MIAANTNINLVIKNVPKMKMKKMKKIKKQQNDNKHKKFDGVCCHCGRKGDVSLVSCLLMTENKKENIKKKVWFADVKQPAEAGMMCTIDGDTFFSIMKTPGL